MDCEKGLLNAALNVNTKKENKVYKMPCKIGSVIKSTPLATFRCLLVL